MLTQILDLPKKSIFETSVADPTLFMFKFGGLPNLNMKSFGSEITCFKIRFFGEPPNFSAFIKNMAWGYCSSKL
jgi:hypothetical protein